MTKHTKKHHKIKKIGESNKALVKIISPIDSKTAFYVQSELMDDEQIEQELLGKMAEFYVYEFPADEGKTVRGLTITGVRDSVRNINKRTKQTGMRILLDPDKMKVEEAEQDGQKGIRVIVWAKDMISGMFNPGTKFEPYQKYSRRQKKMISNTFALEKATSKAIRNAFRGLFPEQLVIKMINQYMKAGKVIKLQAPMNQEQVFVKEVEMKPSTDEKKFDAIMQGIYHIKSKKTAEAWLKQAKTSKELPEKYRKQVVEKLEQKIKLYKED